MLKPALTLAFCFFSAIIIAQPNVSDKYLQKFTEIGIQAGIAGYAGDLGGPMGNEGFKNFSPDYFRPSFNVNATHRMATWASLRPGLTIARIAGDDKILKDGSASDPNLGSRNLSFRSLIGEVSLLADINPLYLFNSYSDKEHKFYPYLSVGLAAFYFNPQANLNGVWYDLKPLRTEGQGFQEYPDRKQYSKISFSIPRGAGFKYYVSPKHYIGAEGIVRRTFTDYLDDVSTTYVHPSSFDRYLTPENADLAQQLYNRDTQFSRPRGSQRGNRDVDDYYFTIALRFGIV